MNDRSILVLAKIWQSYRDSKDITIRGNEDVIGFARAVIAADRITRDSDVGDGDGQDMPASLGEGGLAGGVASEVPS